MTFEIAKKEDLGFVLAIGKDRILHWPLTYKDLCFYLQDNDIGLFKLVLDNSIIGYIILRYELDEAEIDEIAISRQHEGKGIGTYLLEKALQNLKTRNFKKIYLEVRKKNLRAIRLYEKNGFKPYRIRKNYYGDDDAICYLKEL